MSESGSQQLDSQRSATLGLLVPLVFLPGIVQPAALRYARLLDELGDAVRPLVKDLEVYVDPVPPPGYAIEQEVAGVARAADAAGLDRFHLYGHSGGGAIALACAAPPGPRPEPGNG